MEPIPGYDAWLTTEPDLYGDDEPEEGEEPSEPDWDSMPGGYDDIRDREQAGEFDR